MLYCTIQHWFWGEPMLYGTLQHRFAENQCCMVHYNIGFRENRYCFCIVLKYFVNLFNEPKPVSYKQN